MDMIKEGDYKQMIFDQMEKLYETNYEEYLLRLNILFRSKDKWDKNIARNCRNIIG